MTFAINVWKSKVREAWHFYARLSPESCAGRLPALSSRRVASLIQNSVSYIREVFGICRASVMPLRRACALILLGALVPATGCSGKVDLESKWRTKDVFVDGANTEWAGATTYFEDQKLSVGLQNDDEYLYLALFVGDKNTQAQIVMHGCTVWFDPSGKGEKEFGVHYPLGIGPGGRGGEAGDRPSGSGEKGGGPGGAQPDSDMLAEMLSNQPRTVELLGPEPGEYHHQSLVDNKLEVIALVHETSLVYEIKIPLARGGEFLYGIDAEPGMEIAVGVETPEIQRPERPEGMGRGRGGMGGGRGGMGGGRGGMGGGRGGSRPEPPAPLEVWASVKLAPAPSGG
jgi:hypothetical protein